MIPRTRSELERIRRKLIRCSALLEHVCGAYTEGNRNLGDMVYTQVEEYLGGKEVIDRLVNND